MIYRELSRKLENWKKSPTHLPLILRGARQVGKTTLVHEFGKSYDQYLYFNLEKSADASLLDNLHEMEKFVQLLFLSRGIPHDPKRSTLIFFDEAQEHPFIIEALRYFKEDYPHLDIIVTGSLLEFALNKIQRVPVGRVEYAELHPINFREYVRAINNPIALDQYESIPIEPHNVPFFYKLFHDYTMVGGMPGILSAYLEMNDLTQVKSLYAGIVESYKSDVEKYAKSNKQKQIIRQLMDIAPYEIDNRITLNNFGGTGYATREVKEAITALTYARILELIYPTTHTAPPIVLNFKKRPRLHFLDIGLVNYQLGLYQELLKIQDLHQSSKGKLLQQIVNQEIKAQFYLPGTKRAFWVREELNTSSEVDIIYPYQNMLIPIEVKSGASGRLRSLHEFMDRCSHGFAVRIYGGELRVDELTSRKGKVYKLLNLPYFLSGNLLGYLDWFID